jgi:L-asparagine transporter-like permease
MMSIITTTRRPRKRATERRYLLLRSFREVTRSYFARENLFEFVVEFLGIAGISIWPMIMAASALHEFLQRIAN